MLKKSLLFLIPKTPPTKRQLIAASEYAKNPELIEKFSMGLAFIREEKPKEAAKKKRGPSHARH